MVIAENRDIAQRLDETAALLHEQGANPFRVRAYRRAAETVRGLSEPAPAILARDGLEGLEALPAIGEQLAEHIRALAETGRLPMLDRLRGASDPEALLRSIPGIGKKTAARLHHKLGIDTLEELETAAHDGRLKNLGGFGPKKLAGVIDSLASRLRRVRLASGSAATVDEPTVGELLDVDREYRELAQAGKLHLIAPKRFNPRHEAWLPILHTVRGNRHYTALYSNTARAHQLGRTRDWVIVYLDHGQPDRQYTIVTGREGPLAGQRVVRGREAECVEQAARS